MRHLLCFFLFLSAVIPASIAQQADLEPVVTGYVTRGTSPLDFDANGLHVLFTSKTKFSSGTTGKRGSPDAAGTLYLGEAVTIFGKLDRKKHSITATEVIFRTPAELHLSGIAIIDRVLSTDKPGQVLVRADGYPILINAKTRTVFQQPLTSLSSITTNVWLKYEGTQSSDGIIIADAVALSPNTISDSEDKLLAKTDYDPAAVPADSKQSGVSKYFLGINPKKIPPYKDAAMQARIDRIGASLFPLYQRNLPDTDGSKILFQFQLIDSPKFHDALALPSGIILVPHQVVERLQNDSQIATVLADNIATALEKQRYRMQPARNTMTAANLASTAGGFFVPGLGTVTNLATSASSKSIQTDLLDQSGRVSLGFLHDAGYDIQQAPMTWWLLAAKPKKDLSNTPLPPRAANLYRSIGIMWRNNLDTAATTTAGQTAISTKHE